MDKQTKINIFIGISLIIGSFVMIVLNPNSNGLFIAILMASVAFFTLKAAQTKLKNEKDNIEANNERNIQKRN